MMHMTPIICSKGWVVACTNSALSKRSAAAAGRPEPTWTHTGTPSSSAVA